MSRNTKKSNVNHQGPQFVRYFGPVLDALRSLGDSGTPEEVVERVAKDLNLADAVLNELSASGEPRYRNYAHWARFYLVKEGLLERSRRGVWSLSESGRETSLTPEQSQAIFANWSRIFQEQRRERTEVVDGSSGAVVAPEALDLPTDYKSKLLKIIQGLTPSGFERLSQRILREAGFSHVEVTGRSGDGGIDGSGTLQLNTLVSIKVLFQCERYKDSVSPSQIGDFRGAMQGRADKGIVITTGSFTTEARWEASRDGVPTIELIDGIRLIDMLENLQLGLVPRQTFEIDDRFFADFQS